MKNIRKWLTLTVIIAMGLSTVIAFQNCGVIHLLGQDKVNSSSEDCPDFASSRPEHIYEDASTLATSAVFKVNELTSSGNLVTSQRIFDWALDGVSKGSSRDFTLEISALADCQTYEITASILTCGKISTWKKSYMKAGSVCATTTTTLPPPVAGARGCADDSNVPIVREIDFATEPGEAVGPNGPGDLNWPRVFDRPMRAKNDAEHRQFCDSHPEQPNSSEWPSYYQPPSCDSITNIVAVKLIVPPGGGHWFSGSLQLGPTRGTSTAEVVISRCRGQFDAGGRVQVVRLDGYTGAENQSAITSFPSWFVDPKQTPADISVAVLNAQGVRAKDGWLSDGVYYINVRVSWPTAPGVFWRSFAGSGVSHEQLLINTGIDY